MKRRTGDPWMPADRYGRTLPSFTVNLVVKDVARALAFHQKVLEATVHYADADFAALRLSGVDVMLHADHTYDKHPWFGRLTSGEPRGLGAELRVFGLDPDAVAARALAAGAVIVQAPTTKGHGWREVMVEDADGYVWAVGVPTPAETVVEPTPGGIAPGLKGERRFVVSDAMVTRHAGGGGVLTTPSMIAAIEATAEEVTRPLLPAEHTTVGYEVAVRHRAPTALGMSFTVTAELVEVTGRRLLFRVSARNERETIGEGTHRRTVIRLGALT